MSLNAVVVERVIPDHPASAMLAIVASSVQSVVLKEHEVTTTQIRWRGPVAVAAGALIAVRAPSATVGSIDQDVIDHTREVTRMLERQILYSLEVHMIHTELLRGA